jgi:phosphate-selective porin OprO and OprP
MLRALWKTLGRRSLAGIAMLAAAQFAHAQPAPLSPSAQGKSIPLVIPVNGQEQRSAYGAPQDDTTARIERLERQNQELMELLKQLQNRPAPVGPAAPVSTSVPIDNQGGGANKDDVQKLVNDYLKQKEQQEDAKKKEQAAKGFVVGQNLGLNGLYTTGPGSGGYQPWLQTQDNAYRFHVGGRIQPDVTFGARGDKAVEQGKGGTGPFLEGFNFRRARLEVDGWLHENVDYFIEFDWANTPFNTGVKPGNITPAGTPTNTQPFTNILNVPAPTDVWAGVNYIPVIGTVRVGNLKPVIGLDHLTSSRFLDFMERSIGFDTYFNRNNGFEPGFLFANTTENRLASYAISITRTCNGPFGFDQGGGTWDYTGRLTVLPYFEDNGRYMVHLGLGAKYQRLDASTGTGVANLNDRWLLRNTQSGLQNVVSLAVLNGIDQEMINPELFINIGPLSIQSEYIYSRVNGVTAFSTQLTPAAVKIPSTTFNSQTAYIQALYFLTGENRPYGQSYLHSSGPAPTRIVPFKNYYWVPGEGGNGNPFSAGAWQVGARYCYSDLDDGKIHGGIINEVTLGLNWFLNPNMKFQWNYDIGHRHLQGGTSDGYYSGFGMRMAFDF